MQLFQICGNFCSSWIPFSPPLKQVQSLDRKHDLVAGYSEQSDRAQPLLSQEAAMLSSAQRWLSLLSQEFKPLVKLVQNSQIKSAV